MPVHSREVARPTAPGTDPFMRARFVLTLVLFAGCANADKPVPPASSQAAALAVAPSSSASTGAAPIPKIADPAACTEASGVTIIVSPRTPVTGQALRVLVVANEASDGPLVIRDEHGGDVAASTERHGGPP